MFPHYSIIYSYPYLVLDIILFLFAGIQYKYNINNDTKKTISIFLGIVICCFLGLRGHIQTDFIEYYPFFNQLSESFIENSPVIKTGIEPGFVYYTTIIKNLTSNYFIWILINTIIDVVILSWFFKKYSSSVPLSWVFFILFSGLVCEFNLYRNIKAIVIFLISIQFIESRKFLPFILLWLLEVSMHLSAIIYLPMYWILNQKYSKWVIFSLFAFINIIIFTHIHFTIQIIDILSKFIPENTRMITKAVGYLVKSEETVLSFGYLEKTCIFLLCALNYEKLYSKRKSNVIFCNAFFLYYILWYVFSDVKVFVERFPILFVFSYWIICPNLLDLIRTKSRYICIFFIFLFSIMKIISLTNQRPYYYENIIFGIKSYYEKVELINTWKQK